MWDLKFAGVKCYKMGREEQRPKSVMVHCLSIMRRELGRVQSDSLGAPDLHIFLDHVPKPTFLDATPQSLQHSLKQSWHVNGVRFC